MEHLLVGQLLAVSGLVGDLSMGPWLVVSSWWFCNAPKFYASSANPGAEAL